MIGASRSFQVFAKPIGATCNLACHYCYYSKKAGLYPGRDSLAMSPDVLEAYISRQIEAASDQVVRFSWHGGEPTLLGLDYFREVVSLERRHNPKGKRIANGIQTNGTLIDEDWCRFFAGEGFAVGISLDGPEDLHDRFRRGRGHDPSYGLVRQGYELLRRYRIPCEILCVIHRDNSLYPLDVYRFFKEIGAESITFLPLVEPDPREASGASPRSVPAEALGRFLSVIFAEWKRLDIGKVKVDIFEEVARGALGQGPALCVFRKTCGDVPVVEHNGDFYCCDHFVDERHRLGNILETDLVDLLESPAQRAFGEAKWTGLPRYCLRCDVLEMCYGGCPKDRILRTPEGEPGLNYLCAGLREFFRSCLPFVSELASLWHQKMADEKNAPVAAENFRPTPKISRNDPCPCGSGRKFKRCCLGG